MRDLILHVPANPYDTLKRQLIQRTCLPEQRRIHRLVHSLELGDHKPTQLLRRMQQLLGDSSAAADGPLVRELFLQRLATFHRPHGARLVHGGKDPRGDSTTGRHRHRHCSTAGVCHSPAHSGNGIPPRGDERAKGTRLHSRNKATPSATTSFAIALTTPPPPFPISSPALLTHSCMLVPPALWRQSLQLHPTLCKVGKRRGQSLAATNAAGLAPSRLFFFTDRYTGLRFLVDTGAQVSVIPPTHKERQHHRSDLTLRAVNNTPIPTFGTRSLTLNLGLRRTFRWVFIVAESSTPILGADFLRHFGLLVDIQQNKLSDSTTYLTVQGIVSQGESPSLSLLPLNTINPFEAILNEFPAVTQPNNLTRSVKHSVTHHITTVGPPVTGRTRRLPPEKLKIAHQEFHHVLELGII